jgi:quinol monooxygenase YgiN
VILLFTSRISLTFWKDQDKATYDKHFKTEYFQALGATIQKEGLIAAPLSIMTVKPVAGFASR